MDRKKHIVIAEGHAIARAGLRCLLSAENEYEVVAEARDGLEAIRCVESCRPDLVLLDVTLPKLDGMAALKEIKRRFPETRVLVLSAHTTDEYVLEAFRRGANGYCIKDVTESDLFTALRTVLDGQRYLSPGISDKVLEEGPRGEKTLKCDSSWDRLTEREREILKMIGEGYMNKNIAEYLCISVKTVAKHRANLMKKLDLHTASALTAYAIGKGLVAK
ncbi:MAG: DNA-binding response regulator [Candidatus Abyssobacteria bacterium SURF_17]|uniref:DNA-binding response regulator n=1 Tax=Candidatus Abyssobacteria bacterium SURF_17 TaxID=2093361 RepID=A0A419ERR9_9BACT|nr:MAG: DNA-binding response regulator [Candidatus Abyssubacteria bacterium SURF_17]